MVISINPPDASALLAVETDRQFICLVVLCAVRDRVEQVRFERRPADWIIVARQEGSWREYLPPVDRAAAVGPTLWKLTRRPGLLGWLGLGDPDCQFSLQLAEDARIECRVAPDGANRLLSIRPRGVTAALAGELIQAYIEMQTTVEAGA
jgi:hypothetical protein